MEFGFAATIAIDWDQTRTITAECNERNPVIGPCGETPIWLYFPSVIVLHTIAAALLPPDWRTAWQAFGMGLEVNQVWDNAR